MKNWLVYQVGIEVGYSITYACQPDLEIELCRTSCPVGKSGKISKSGLSQNPDVFLPGRQTFNTFKNKKNLNQKIFIFFSIFFFQIFFCSYALIQNFYTKFVSRDLMRIDNLYSVGKMFKNVWIKSGLAGPVQQIWVSDPVRSGDSYAQSG